SMETPIRRQPPIPSCLSKIFPALSTFIASHQPTKRGIRMSTRQLRLHTKSPMGRFLRRASVLFFAAGLAVARLSAGAADAAKASTLEQQFRANYAALYTAPQSAQLAGVNLSRVAIPNLVVSNRDVRTADRGGIVLSFADQSGNPRAVVTIAVFAD